MARGKKAASALSPEEKLHQALVPTEEQPYSIPENWCWVKLGKLYEINPKVTADDTVLASFVPMERIEAGMTGRFTFEIQPWGKARKNHTQFADGDVAFAKISPCFENQKSMVVQGLTNGIGGGTTELIILRQALMNQKYTFLLVSTEDFISRGSATYSGTVGQQRISMDFVKEYPVPVPPFSEQQRIVARIESLFAKLDEAKEKAQAVVDGFELRKSAILHKAFTGELTEPWRKENGVGLDSWKQAVLIDVLKEPPHNGYSPKPVNYVTPYKSMTLSATTSGVFKDEYFKYIDETIPEDSYLWLKPGDILIQRANSLDKVGTSAVYTGREHEFIYPDLMMKLQVVETASPQFVAYSLKRDDSLAYFRANATGTAGNMPKINQKTVSQVPLNLPTYDEQVEIVRILDSILTREQQAKKTAEAVLSQIDTMKKAILARAFRGELGTNDPAEEWAGELLKIL